MKESIMSNTVNQQTSNNRGEKIKNEESNHPKKKKTNKQQIKEPMNSFQ